MKRLFTTFAVIILSVSMSLSMDTDTKVDQIGKTITHNNPLYTEISVYADNDLKERIEIITIDKETNRVISKNIITGAITVINMGSK